MRSEEKPQKTRKISRRYEPDRLSLKRLADAYEKVVPRYIRILGEWSIDTKTEKVHEQDVNGGRNGTEADRDLCTSLK
jgi:hypothetical protein